MAYTKPDLRERLKKQIMSSGKGGDPGEWSARKAQLLAAEYEKKGGGYRGGKTEPQKSLTKWTGEKWGTSDGKPSEGKKRYLPEKAWDKLTPSEKAATNRAKAEGNQAGKQFVKQPESVAKKAAAVRRGP
jgi:hypothetical protein